MSFFRIAAGCLVSVFVSASGVPASDPQQVVIHGQYRVVVTDVLDGGSSVDQSVIADGVRYPVQGSALDQVAPGSDVEVAGTLTNGSLAVESVQQTGSPKKDTTGTKSVLIIPVYETQPDARTPSRLEAMVGTTGDTYYDAASYGQTRLTAVATPWLQIPTQTGCDLDQIASDAEHAAVAIGYDPDAYHRVMIYFPLPQFGCGGPGGIGEVPGRYTWIRAGQGQDSIGWDASYASVMVHELGHNFGLWHANGFECYDALGQRVPLVTTADCQHVEYGVDVGPVCSCRHVEYGDSLDVMGVNGLRGDLSALQKDSLGWLAGRAQDVTQPGTYWLAPLERLSPSAAQALRISDGQVHYWIESRWPEGNDSWLTDQSGIFFLGARIHAPAKPFSTSLLGTELLDMTPLDHDSSFRAGLFLGASWTTPNERWTITVGSGYVGANLQQVDVSVPPKFLSPLRDAVLKKSAASIPVKVTLQLDDATSAALAANQQVRVTLDQQEVPPATDPLRSALCSWNAKGHFFECALKTPKGLQTGVPYYIHAQRTDQPYGTVWYDAVGPQNPLPVFFK